MTSTPPPQPQPPSPPFSLASEGSLHDMKIAPSEASKPGSMPGFYNPKRRIGRDFVVLSVAQWLADEAIRRAPSSLSSSSSTSDKKLSGDVNSPTLRPARLLDATCATGMQGLRAAVESPLLAKASISERLKNDDDDDKQQKLEFPELHVILNDMDDDAANLATQNSASLQMLADKKENDLNLTITRRVAQAFLQEETFEVSVLDPFGSVQLYVDAALARAPNRGLIEICATDVGVLYGARTNIAKRHYHADLSHKRPPCYRERGMRLLIAAIAQAAGRYDRGIVPVYGVSTEHFCLASVRVVRGAKAADSTAKHVQRVRICRTCGAAGDNHDNDNNNDNTTTSLCQCGCEPIYGSGINAQEEGPLWVGPLYDTDVVRGMTNIANLKEAKGLISNETRNLLTKIKEESVVDNVFHRRPGVAAKDRIPKLVEVIKELENRGFKAARTHFCVKSLKSNASTEEFDDAVKAVLLKETSKKRGYDKI